MAVYDTVEAKYQNLVKLFESKLTEDLGPIRESFENLSGETKSFLEQVNKKFHEQEEEIKQLKLAAQRPTMSQAEVKEEVSTKRRSAMNKALRGGWGSLNAEEKQLVRHSSEDPYAREIQYAAGLNQETKALYAADGTTGGFLATPEFVNDLIKAIVLVSPMMSVVDVRMTDKPYIMIPKRTQTGTAVRVAEQATRTETQNPKFGLVQVYPFESFALTLVSRTDIDDAEIDLAQFVQDDMAVQFAKLAGNEMINGTGSGAGQCLGFLNDTSITSSATTSSVSGSWNAGDFTKLVHSLKTGYRQGAVFLGTTESLGQVRGLTDTTGRPLWMPFGSDGATGKIYGYDYIEAPDMPQTSLNGGSSQAYALAFGNFKTGYQAVVRKQISIITLNERYADQNAVGYLGYYRFGGTTKLAEAIKVMKCHS